MESNDLTLILSGLAAIASTISAIWIIKLDLRNKPILKVDNCKLIKNENKEYELSFRVSNRGNQPVQVVFIWYTTKRNGIHEKCFLHTHYSNTIEFNKLINPKSYEFISTDDLSILFNIKGKHFFITDYYKKNYIFNARVLKNAIEEARKYKALQIQYSENKKGVNSK